MWPCISVTVNKCNTAFTQKSEVKPMTEIAIIDTSDITVTNPNELDFTQHNMLLPD